FANFRYVSADFFTVFGRPPSAGRVLRPADRDGKAVVSRQFAESHYGSAQAALGRSISVYGISEEIVGVAAPGFHFPEQTNIWISAGPADPNRIRRDYQVIGKLRAGYTAAAARTQMQTIGARLAQQYSEDRSTSVAVTPLQERLTGSLK